MRTSFVLVLITISLGLLSPALMAQEGEGQPAPPPPAGGMQARPGGFGAPGAPMDAAAMQQRMQEFQRMMVDRMLQEAKLTPEEEAAARKAIERKQKASSKLSEELGKLRQAAMKDDASEAELKIALELFGKALAAYRQEVAAADAELVKVLSLQAKARLTALGVLDNGLPSMLARGPGMGMMGGMGARTGGTGGRRFPRLGGQGGTGTTTPAPPPAQ